MDAAEFRTLRIAADRSVTALADELGLARMTATRYESGDRPIPDDVADRLRALGVDPGPITTKPDAAVVTLPVAKASTFDPIRVGLKPWGERPDGVLARDFDKHPVGAGWQVVMWRVVHSSIPDPIPYEAPAWAGWRGVVTASGRVFDYETGAEMRDIHGVGPKSPRRAPGSLAIDKTYKKR